MHCEPQWSLGPHMSSINSMYNATIHYFDNKKQLLQTGLGDPSSDVPSSSTSVLVLMGTDLPWVIFYAAKKSGALQ